MNHRKAGRAHVLKRLKQRFNIEADGSAIAEFKRQIREGEAIQLRRANRLKKIDGVWQAFYSGHNIRVVYDDLRGIVKTVY